MRNLFTGLLMIISSGLWAQWNAISTFSNPYQTLAVPSDSNVFFAAMNKYIYYSHNGGTDWNFVETEYEYEFLEDMDFVNDSVGFVCGGGWFTPHRNLILRTTDAGQSWQTLTRDSLGIYQFLFSKIDFVNIDSGMVIEGYGGEIFRTLDGGENWQQVYIDSGSYFKASDIYFVNGSVGFVTSMGYGPSSTKAKIFKTTDFGMIWQLMKEWNEESSFYKISFVDDNNGFVGGSDGMLFKTTDGGTTWTEVSVAPGNDITALWFTAPNIGYSNALGVIAKTTDAGNSWSAQLMDFPGIVKDIQFSPGKQTGFLITDSYVYITQNGGGDVTAIENIYLKSRIKVYPNPARQLINIEYPKELTIQSIQLMDISGRLIKVFPNKASLLDISEVASGTYLLNIEAEAGSVVEKIIVQ